MDLEGAFLHAALPEPVTILRHPLQPYSLGHEIILRRIGSPFLAASGRFTEEEWKAKFFTAIFVCSRSWTAATAGLLDEALPKYFLKMRKVAGKFDLQSKIGEFIDYLRAGRTCPEYRKIRKRGFDTVTLDTPLLARLHFFAVSECGMSNAEAMDCPFGLLHWLYCVALEDRGWVKLTGKATDSIFDTLRQAAIARGLVPIRIDPEDK